MSTCEHGHYHCLICEVRMLNNVIQEQQKEIDHWKRCTDNEQKIAGKLQKKVERLEKELNG